MAKPKKNKLFKVGDYLTLNSTRSSVRKFVVTKVYRKRQYRYGPQTDLMDIDELHSDGSRHAIRRLTAANKYHLLQKDPFMSAVNHVITKGA